MPDSETSPARVMIERYIVGKPADMMVRGWRRGHEVRLGCVFALCAVPGLVLANAVESATSLSEPVMLFGVEQCPDALPAYVEWRSRSLSVGSELDEEEYRWLEESGYSFSEPDGNKLPLLKDEVKIHAVHIEPEQGIRELTAISAKCALPRPANGRSVASDAALAHTVAVKGKDDDGSESTRYLTFHDGRTIVWGTEFFGDPDGVSMSFEPMPLDFEEVLAARTIEIEDELRRFKGLPPDRSMSPGEQVELFFDWPIDLLSSTDEHVLVERFEGGEPVRYQLSELRYESVVSRADEGVRVSALADGLAFRYKNGREELWQEWQPENDTDCATDGSMSSCWQWSAVAIPPHYGIDSRGDRVHVPVDERYTEEVDRWMSERLTGVAGASVFQQKMKAFLDEAVAGEDSLSTFRQAQFSYGELHGLVLDRGEQQPAAYLFHLPTLHYADPPSPFREPPLVMTCTGPKRCDENDVAESCIELGFSPDTGGSVDVDPAIRNEVVATFLLDPHTLLPYAFHHRFSGAQLADDAAEPALAEILITVDVRYRYAPLP